MSTACGSARRPVSASARLLIRYRLGDLLRGRLASVEIDGLELRGRLVDGRLELAGFEAPDEAPARRPAALLPWPEKIVLRAAEIPLATPWGELRAPLAGELRPTAGRREFSLEMSGGELINDAGRLRADLTVRGQRPARSGDRARATRWRTGRLASAAETFALPGLAGGIDGGGELAFELAGRPPGCPARAGELRVAAARRRRWHRCAAPLPPPWRILLGDAAPPLRVSGALAGDRPALELDGALRLAAGPARSAPIWRASSLSTRGPPDRGRRPRERHRERAALAGGDAREGRARAAPARARPRTSRRHAPARLGGSAPATPAGRCEGAALRHRLAA